MDALFMWKIAVVFLLVTIVAYPVLKQILRIMQGK